MHTILPIEALGQRIIVLGPTNSGKSTLALALSRRLDIPAVYLDQLRHLPDTMWVQRPDEEFGALHDQAILADTWVIDGSYSRWMPQRLQRATGIIVLDDTLPIRLGRYLWRSTFQKERVGGLSGNRDGISMEMLSWLWKTRNKTEETRQWAGQSGLPCQFIHNGRELRELYVRWGLTR